jgi:hypothetical protein
VKTIHIIKYRKWRTEESQRSKEKRGRVEEESWTGKGGILCSTASIKEIFVVIAKNTEPKETVPNHGNTDATATAVIDEDVTIDSEEIKITPALDDV